jgi:hypothetical protein
MDLGQKKFKSFKQFKSLNPFFIFPRVHGKRELRNTI